MVWYIPYLRWRAIFYSRNIIYIYIYINNNNNNNNNILLLLLLLQGGGGTKHYRVAQVLLQYAAAFRY